MCGSTIPHLSRAPPSVPRQILPIVRFPVTSPANRQAARIRWCRLLPWCKLRPPTGKFDLKAAFWQSFGVTFFFEAWRVAFDPGMRWNLAHKPFYHDWFASYGGYNMKRWGDGDDFVVNDVGHPLEGAVFARNFLHQRPQEQRCHREAPRILDEPAESAGMGRRMVNGNRDRPDQRDEFRQSGRIHLCSGLRHVFDLPEQSEVSQAAHQQHGLDRLCRLLR